MQKTSWNTKISCFYESKPNCKINARHYKMNTSLFDHQFLFQPKSRTRSNNYSARLSSGIMIINITWSKSKKSLINFSRNKKIKSQCEKKANFKQGKILNDI